MADEVMLRDLWVRLASVQAHAARLELQRLESRYNRIVSAGTAIPEAEVDDLGTLVMLARVKVEEMEVRCTLIKAIPLERLQLTV